MEHPFWTAFGVSFLAAFITSEGIYVIRRFEKWGHRNSIYFICFAAGVLISVSFLHIIPKAFTMNAHASFYLLAGYFGLHLFNRFINAFVCDKNLNSTMPSAWSRCWESASIPLLMVLFTPSRLPLASSPVFWRVPEWYSMNSTRASSPISF